MSSKIPSRGRQAASHWMTEILVFSKCTFDQSKIQRVKVLGTRVLFIIVGPLTVPSVFRTNLKNTDFGAESPVFQG